MRPPFTIIASLAFIFMNVDVKAQLLDRTYDHEGGGGVDIRVDHELFGDDGYIVVSRVDSVVQNTGSPWVLGAKFINGNGDLLFEREYPRPPGIWMFEVPSGRMICRTSDRGYALLARSAYSGSTRKYYLYRLSPIGELLWTREDTIPGSHWVNSILETSDRGFFVSSSSPIPTYDPHIFRMDSMGHVLWQYRFGDDQRSELVSGAIETQDHGFIIYGSSSEPNLYGPKGWAARVDSVGEVLWQRIYEQPGNESNFIGGTALRDGGYVLVGYLDTTWGSFSSNKHYMVRIDELGDTLWTYVQHEPASPKNYFTDVLEHPNGNMYAVGHSANTPDLNLHGGVTCVGPDGEQLWRYDYRHQEDSTTWQTGRLSSILLDHDLSSVICAGQSNRLDDDPWSDSGEDAWLLRLGEDGCLVPGCDGIGIKTQELGNVVELTVRPNPSTGKVWIDIGLSPTLVLNDDLRMTLVDQFGKPVLEQVIDRWHVQGLQLDLGTLTPGLFHLHLSSGTHWLAGRKVVLR